MSAADSPATTAENRMTTRKPRLEYLTRDQVA